MKLAKRKLFKVRDKEYGKIRFIKAETSKSAKRILQKGIDSGKYSPDFELVDKNWYWFGCVGRNRKDLNITRRYHRHIFNTTSWRENTIRKKSVQGGFKFRVNGILRID